MSILIKEFVKYVIKDIFYYKESVKNVFRMDVCFVHQTTHPNVFSVNDITTWFDKGNVLLQILYRVSLIGK